METMVKERPILFSGPMVKAILEGRKTQTRRVIKQQPERYGDRVKWCPPNAKFVAAVGDWAPCCKWDASLPVMETGAASIVDYCPYGQPGERLWVREALRQKRNGDYSGSPHAAPSDWVYSADDELLKPNWVEMAGWSVHRSKPSIHMPRWASRITLEVTGVRVERLQEITNSDAQAEGVMSSPHRHGSFGYPLYHDSEGKPLPDPYRHKHDTGVFDCFLCPFMRLWSEINGPGSWDANPWVWVVEFKKTT